jgi:ParB family chromosome partitioning protein
MVMQDAQNNATSNEYRSVPISILVESATNPRKRFDEKNLEELAASMRAQGVLAPLLVRELSLGHVASEQRSWRNSKPFPSVWSN